jgi:hypothetical protein
MFGEDKMALVYFVSSKGIFVYKYPLNPRYSDWIVLEIITQWTGKTIAVICCERRPEISLIAVLVYEKFYWQFDHG